MSIVFSEKTRRTPQALRWPFSRQLTLSVGTLLVLLAVWWLVAEKVRLQRQPATRHQHHHRTHSSHMGVSPFFWPPPTLCVFCTL